MKTTTAIRKSNKVIDTFLSLSSDDLKDLSPEQFQAILDKMFVTPEVADRLIELQGELVELEAFELCGLLETFNEENIIQ